MGIVAKGVDISHHNGIIDFKALAKEVDFVIIKAGGSEKRGHVLFKDIMYEQYYRQAKEAGLKVGAYFFAGPDFNIQNSVQDAAYFWSLLQGKQYEYPVFIDIEAQASCDRLQTTQGVLNFCEYLENRKYFVGIYASDISGFKSLLSKQYLRPYTWWVARYGRNPNYAIENLGIWQTSSTGSISGVRGNVDTDVSFIKYDDIIKKKHLNGF